MPAVPFCQICYSSSRSECEPTATDSQEDWIALTDCGHVYHTLCVKRWWQEKHALGCPLNCAFRNVKSDKRTGDGHAMVRRQQLQEPMPYLRLYGLNWTENTVCSSDPVDAAASRDIVKQERPPKKRARLDGDADSASETDDASGDAMLSAAQGSQEASTSTGTSGGAARPQQGLDRRILDLEADGRRKAREIVDLKETIRDLRGTITELETSLEQAQELESDGNEECLRERAEIRAAGPWGWREDDDGDMDREDFAPDEVDCECARCRPTGRRRVLQEEVRVLQEEVRALEQQLATLRASTVPRRRLEAAEAARAALQERFDETVRAHTAYQNNYDALRNDLHTERIQRRQTEAQLRKQLDERGESGAARIAELCAEVDERDNRIMHLKASIDRIELEAQQKIKAAEEATNRARQQASVDISTAKERAALAEAARTKELSRLKRYEAANAGYERQLATLKIKLEKLKAKRGIAATESDVDEPAEPVFSNRSFARTTSSRSHFSMSPPPSPPSGVQVNNKSMVFATSPRKQRHARTPFDDWELSRAESRQGATAEAEGSISRDATFGEGEDDELEYADVATGEAVTVSPRKKQPTIIELSDDDDDEKVERSSASRPAVVTSSHFGGKHTATKAKAPTTSSATRKTGQQQLPFAALTNSVTSASRPTWKKPEEAPTNKQDKWLPKLTEGLVDTGSKRRVKRK